MKLNNIIYPPEFYLFLINVDCCYFHIPILHENHSLCLQVTDYEDDGFAVSFLKEKEKGFFINPENEEIAREPPSRYLYHWNPVDR